MTAGTPFVADEVSTVINGDTVEEAPNALQAQFPGQTITPTASFNFAWNGTIIQYSLGDTQVVTPDLLAALTAAGAPFTTP